MVKKIFGFLHWQFSRFKWHDSLWFVGCFLIGAGWSGNNVMLYLGIGIMVTMFFGGIIKIQWDRWKAERKELLKTIKDPK